jgi:hypothetical protein
VAKKAGLAGKTEEEQLQAEVILEHVNDFIKGERFQFNLQLQSVLIRIHFRLFDSNSDSDLCS